MIKNNCNDVESNNNFAKKEDLQFLEKRFQNMLNIMQMQVQKISARLEKLKKIEEKRQDKQPGVIPVDEYKNKRKNDNDVFLISYGSVNKLSGEDEK